MAVRFGLYEALLVVAAITSVAVATYTWRRREKPGAEFLTLVLVSDACWALVSLVGSLASGDRLALTSAKTVYLFAPVTVAGLFLFALAYTGRKQWLGPRLYGALAIEPLLVNVAVWTSPYHDLFWTIPGPSQTARIGWQISFGPLFKGHVVYSYLLVGIASVWLVQFALKSEHLYQRQVFGLIASLVPPWAGNVLFVSEYIASDPTPVAFAITSITLTWAISRTHVLDIAPIARDAVVDTIGDGVVVLDDSGRIVDTNPTARALFDWPDTLVGAEFVSLLDGRPVTESRVQTLLERREEGTLELQLDGQYYTIDVSPLSDVRGVFLGHVLLVHDVTEQKQRQLELQRRNEQLDRFAGVVSHDLRNPLHVASGTLSLARESHELSTSTGSSGHTNGWSG